LLSEAAAPARGFLAQFGARDDLATLTREAHRPATRQEERENPMLGRCRAGWVLALLLGLAGHASAQERAPPPVELKENYPNPFFPSTTIPFVLNPELCERGHQPLVSLRVYNVLAQVVAVPVLLESNGEHLDNVRLPCGSHEAFWDGKVLTSSRELTPGVYYAHLLVDGDRYTLKMIARR
jgi:hypothetical protein